MAFKITDFTLDDIASTVGGALADTSLANALGIQGNSNTLRQFYNRMGVNATYFADKSVFKLAKQYYFNLAFDFKPANSNIRTLLSKALSTSDTDDLKYLVQSVEIPNFRSFRAEELHTTEVGNNSPAGLVVTPSDNQFTISFLNTEYSIHEHVLYYWMKESVDNKWSYAERPFTKANVEIRMLDSKTSEPIYGYKFYGVYPHEIETANPNHSSDTPMTRTAIFNFDMMAVIPSEKTTSSVLDDVFDKYVGDKIGNKFKRSAADVANKINV